ncbi:hypothetical protein RIF29_16247 [Crotalaria pallida]|uniref:Uncharacterized protein n=1 Tax=Crotalaria pallida TaxID=3830 RepID=A0AAN9IEA1_CROPI
MYVTRPLSMYKKDPSALTQPPQGPNSGYLVLMDEEARNRPIAGYEYKIKQLPFPQNKNLSVDYVTDDDAGDKVLFIPVLNQPLSSNRYYVIGRWWVYPGYEPITLPWSPLSDLY